MSDKFLLLIILHTNYYFVINERMDSKKKIIKIIIKENSQYESAATELQYVLGEMRNKNVNFNTI